MCNSLYSLHQYLFDVFISILMPHTTESHRNLRSARREALELALKIARYEIWDPANQAEAEKIVEQQGTLIAEAIFGKEGYHISHEDFPFFNYTFISLRAKYAKIPSKLSMLQDAVAYYWDTRYTDKASF